MASILDIFKTSNTKQSRYPERTEPQLENVTFSTSSPTALFDLYGTNRLSEMPITENTARSISTVWRCINLISGGISAMPINFFERGKFGEAIPIDHDYWYLLNERSTKNYSSFVLKDSMTQDLLLHGDAFCSINRKNKFSDEIVSIDWSRNNYTGTYINEMTGELYYSVYDTINKVHEIKFQEDVIHIPGAGFDGLRGMSAIQYGLRNTVAISKATEDHSEAFYRNGTRPEYVIEFPKEARLSPTEQKALTESINEKHSGSKNHNKPLILFNSGHAAPLQLSQADAQLLQSRQFQVEEICRFFGVPSHMVSSPNATSWGTGVEQMSIGFVQYALLPIITKYEQELNAKLFPTNEKIFVKFDPSSLERGDYKSTIESLRASIGRAGEAGILTQNEARKKLGLPPVDGGDEIAKPNQQLQLQDQPKGNTNA